MNLSGNRNDLSRKLLPQNVSSNTAISLTGSSNAPTPFGSEIDPIFSAWDRSTGILINVAQLIDNALLVRHTDLPTISINTTGTLIANNLSGNNTGDQDLTGLVPYSGASQNINLGIRTITGLKFFATTLPIALNELTTKQYVDNQVLTGGGGGPFQPQLNGTGYVKANGTLISYDNTSFETANPNIQLHISNLLNPHATTYTQVGAQIAKSPLELYVSAIEKSYWNGKQDALGFTPENIANKGVNNGYAGLDSGGKVPTANLPSTLLIYKGVWNALTNTPTLVDPDLTKAGFVYNVGTAGIQFAITWKLGDWLIYNDLGVIEKSDNSDDVTSVNTQTGAVVLGYADVGAAAASHVHGNITNIGAIGITANLPLITTTAGAITTGIFGTAINTFAQGNDSRFTDARTPLAHALIDSIGHTVSGLTAGHFLKATSPTTYGFAVHGLTPADIGAVPYTGATADLNLGIYNFINTGYTSTQNFNISNHYTGFEERLTSTLSFIPGVAGATRTLTITCAGTFVWIDGVRYSLPTLSRQITSDVTALYWFWITAPGGIPQLNHATTPPGFGVCLVATVYWNTTIDKGMVGDERHWMGRDKWMHEYLHQTIGARYASGLLGTFTSTTFNFTAGEIYDEDIEIEFIGTTTNCRVLYKNGSSDWEWDDPNTTGYKLNGTRLRYNNGNNLADLSNGEYMAVWFFGTNNIDYPIMSLIGQRVDGSLANSRLNNNPSSLLLGALPSAEMKLLFRVIYRQINATTVEYQESADYRTNPGVSGTTPLLTDHSTLSNLLFASSGHVGFEADLGLPALNGYMLTSTTLGIRSWIAPPISFPGFGITAGTAAEGNDTRLSDARTPLPHSLIDLVGHTVSGLTTGHFLKATGATTYAFGVHGLTAIDVGAEPSLGNPLVNGYVLSSTTGGVRSWVLQSGAMIYPGAGIAVSTGSGWGTSIVDNSTTWNSLISFPGFGITGATACVGNDSRLSDSRTPLSHVHGNISNGGAIGITTNLPIITGVSGILQTGSFGTGATDFCVGNDSRLSDARTPLSHIHGNITNGGLIGITANLPIITGTGGILQVGAFGTGATNFCVGNDARLSDARTPLSHIHGNITNAGLIGSTANLPLITTTSGLITVGAFGNTLNSFCQGNDSRLSDARTPLSHTIESHTATVTLNQVLKGTGVNTFGWGSLAAGDVGAEPALGNPLVNGYVLSSTTGGVRSWVVQSGVMVYPGAGIPLSTGSGWDTSITNNSANWNTAYGWGNHAGLYALLAHSQAESSITFTDITTGDATTGQHGYLPKLGGGTTNFLRADGTWAAPAGGGGGTVNSGTINTLAFYAATGTAVSGLTAITASRALKSNANGLPVHFDTATEPSLTELTYVKGVTSAIQTQLDAKSNKTKTLTPKSTTYSIQASDADTIIECTGTFTVTFPNSMATGMRVDIINVSTGVITLAASTTLNSKGSNKKLASQWIGASVYHRGSNVWVAVGDLTA